MASRRCVRKVEERLLIVLAPVLIAALGASIVVRAAQQPASFGAAHIDFAVVVHSPTADSMLSSREYRGSADLNLGRSTPALRGHVELSRDYGYDLVMLGNDFYTRAPAGNWTRLSVSGIVPTLLAAYSTSLQSGDPNRIAGALYADLSRRGLPVQRLADETVNGKAVQRYQVATDQGGLPALLGAPGPQGLAWLIGQLTAVGQPGALPATALVGAASVTWDIWLGADDGFPYRFSLSVAGDAGLFAVTADNMPLPQPVAIDRPQ